MIGLEMWRLGNCISTICQVSDGLLVANEKRAVIKHTTAAGNLDPGCESCLRREGMVQRDGEAQLCE